MKTFVTTTLLASILFAAQIASAKSIRATELTPEAITAFASGKSEIEIEFRQGDQLPLNIMMAGDLFETSNAPTVYLAVKNNFWVKIANDQLLMSRDGQNFKPYHDIVSGMIQVGADTDQHGGATGIQVRIHTQLKN